MTARRILFVAHVETMGGASHSLLENVRTVQQAGCTARVVLPREGPLAGRLRELGIEPDILPTCVFPHATLWRLRLTPRVCATLVSKAVLNAFCFAALLLRYRPSLVVINSSATPVCALVARALRFAVAWHVREIFPDEKRDLRSLFLRQSLKRCATRIIVTSRASLENARAPHARVIPCAVDGKHFAQAPALPRAELGLGEEDVVFGVAGRLAYEKGLHIFVAAAFAVARQHDRARFLIVGDETMGHAPAPRAGFERALRDTVSALGMTDRVLFAGFHSRPASVLRALDVLVFPNLVAETFGRSILEAMTLAKPVIASRIGAAPEIVENERTGLLVEPGSAAALSRAMIRLATDTAESRAMGERGAERAQQHFARENIQGALWNTYLECLLETKKNSMWPSVGATRRSAPTNARSAL